MKKSINQVRHSIIKRCSLLENKHSLVYWAIAIFLFVNMYLAQKHTNWKKGCL